MKKIILIFACAALSSTVLFGCGSDQATKELDKNDTNKTQAKVDDKSKTDAKSADAKKDIWTYFDNAKWSEDYGGLKMEIQKVVVSDKSPKLGNDQSEGEFSSLVGIKFKMENTTQGKFTAYPDQAKLVTSTGEQIDNPEMFVSDHIGGEIDEGVVKEGNIIWQLKRGHAEDIKWVKFEWPAHKGGDDQFDTERKVFSVKLDLK